MAYSKQDLTNAGIPHEVRIEDLYQEIKNGGLTTLPRRSMARTLRNKYPYIKTLGDLFEPSSPNTKSIIEFKTGILAMAPAICAVHDASTAITTVPSSSFSTLEEGLRSFLSEYIMAKRKRAHYTNHQVKATENLCTVLEILFDELSADNSRDKAAKVIKTKRQNVDHIINKRVRDEFHELFYTDKTPDNIAADPNLVTLIRSFTNQFVTPGTVDKMMQLSGIKSPRMLELLALVTGNSIQDSGVVIRFGESGGVDIALNSGRVKRILKDEGIPIPFSDFRILLDKEFPDPQLRASLETFARGNHELETFIDKKGKECIAVRWEYLNDLDTEIVRILYDMGAWGLENIVSPDVLKDEWEKRARLSGRKKIQYNPQYKHWRLCPTRMGYVMLRWSKGDDFVDGQKYVSKLLFDNPGWTKDDVLKQADKDGYTKIYERRSLETYYSNAKEDHLVENALVACVKILDYASGNTLPFKDLLKQVNGKGIPILIGQLRRWLMRNKGTFSYQTAPGKRAVQVKLISKRVPLLTTTAAWKAATAPVPVPAPAPAAVTPKPAVASSPSIDWKATFAAIMSKVPETKAFPSLIANADKVFDIMKGGDTVLRHNNVFLSWLPNLTEYDSMTSWGKDSFRKSVLLTVEVFISSFYQMKNNSDLCTDILYDPTFSVRGSIGLGTMLAYLGHISLIPKARAPHRPGSIEEAFCKASTAVVPARNDVGHPGITVDLKESEMSAQIHDALLLFLYLASKV